MNLNYDKLSLCGAAAAIRNGQISASELNRHCLEVAKKTAGLNAFVVIDEQYVLEQAAKTDEKIRSGEDAGAIAGVPVGVKDNMATEVLPTSCASKSLQSNTIERKDCGAVKKLREGGGVIFGKTNMDEFAMGFTGTNTAFGEVSNPYNKDYSAGGSSSGSAAAVAAGSVLGALGSDTGGSIRQPAANCGVCGLKPTFNSVSRDGMFPLSETLDHVGCLTRSARDNALLFSVLSEKKRSFENCFLNGAERGLKIAFLDDFNNAFADDDVLRLYFASVEAFRQDGLSMQGLSFSFSKDIAETYTVLCSTEAVESFRRFNRLHPLSIVLEKCGKEVNKRIGYGLKILNDTNRAPLEKAARVRAEVNAFIDRVFEGCDVILSPTTLLAAQRKDAEVDNEKGFTSDLFSIVCNLTGIPALSVPCGLDGRGLPVGLMIMARRGREDDIYRAAGFFLNEQHDGENT
ncbi:MAG TPA: Asp-tRNA(Asn)/Glu-tRNA(Gln) amidotransferase subunit GatA [Clostridiales bacterium]|nr:Asp-tRNA(Asn)/Glu-tRNA(Gln) amidotransferase subunit GatA [Clostridiales bacterium]